MLHGNDKNASDNSEVYLTRHDHDALRIWVRLMAVHKLITTEIRQRIQAEFGISLSRFDLMAPLARVPEGLRMVELSRHLMVTSGNVTQITDQLEAEGFVERREDPISRRACIVRLTKRGRDAFAPVAEAHEQWVIELLSGLSQKERQILLSLLAKEKAHLSAHAKEQNSKTDPASRRSFRGKSR